MFRTIFQFEMRFWSKQISIYFYALSFLFLATLVMAGTAGLFDKRSTAMGPFNHVNSPAQLLSGISFFIKFILFLLPTIIGFSVYRDYKSHMHKLLYSFPFSKKDYLLAKFTSSFLVTILVVITIMLGFIIGSLLPAVDPRLIGPFKISAYLQVLFVFVIPNLLFFGTIVFAVLIYSRNIYAGFIAIILLIVLQDIGVHALGNLNSDYLAAILDPFGNKAAFYYTKAWTIEQQNSLLLPFSELLLFNRLLYLVLTAGIFTVLYRYFDFNQEAKKVFKLKRGNSNEESLAKLGVHKRIKTITFRFSFIDKLKTMYFISSFDLRFMFRNWMFLLILISGIILIFFQQAQMNPPYGYKILPVTWKMLKIPSFLFSGIINMLTFLYVGILVHRAKLANTNQLVDVSPVESWMQLMGKFLAIVRMQMLLLLLIPIAGISVQLSQGFYNIELSLYFIDIYGLSLISFIIWGALAMFVQSLFKNPYLGFFVLLAIPVGIAGLANLGLEHKIFQFNMGSYSYSDLSGYQGLGDYWIYKSLWFISAILFLSLSYLLWDRGLPESFLARIKIARDRFQGKLAKTITIALLSFFTLSASIYAYDKKLNPDFNPSQQKKILREAQKTYQKFADMKQAKIVAVDLELDLFPDEERFEILGQYTLENKSTQPIDTLLVTAGFDEITELDLDEHATLVLYDSLLKFSVYKLNKPLNVGDSLRFSFKLRNKANNIFARNSNVLKNASFLKQDMMPRMYFRYGNFDKDRSNPDLLNYNYQARDADMIDFRAQVSTSKDQTAVAPGFLKANWTENNRNYFLYEMDDPMKFLFAFSSGRFERIQSKIDDVNLEMLVDPKHKYNLERITRGLKAALKHNRKFSPFQYDEIRLVEFDKSEGSYATIFGHSMPFSEIILLNDIDDTNPESFDFPFYIAAHELSHLWWGNQIVSADIAGAKMLSETMTEYFSLRILEEEYKKAKVIHFLKMNLELYKRGRNSSRSDENALIDVGDSQYITNRKGMINIYAFSEALGKEKFDAILKRFISDKAFKSYPYTSSYELISYLRKETPDSLRYLITDLFERVTISDNSIVSVNEEKIADDSYELEVDFIISKYRAEKKQARYSDNGLDSLSYETGNKVIHSLNLNDYVDISILDKNKTVISRKKIKVSSIFNRVHFRLDRKASEVVLDPDLTLIDFNLKDNRKTIE